MWPYKKKTVLRYPLVVSVITSWGVSHDAS